MSLKDQTTKQLEDLISDGTELENSYQLAYMGSYESDAAESQLQAFVTKALATIVRLTGRDSEYYMSIPERKDDDRLALPGTSGPRYIPAIVGSLTALKHAVENDLLVSLENRIAANIHDDLLEQAVYLLREKYHVAAMVLIGGVFENHLNKLCVARRLKWSGHGNLSKCNDLLFQQAKLYDQPTWRRIQAVTDRRNNAAHGKPAEVNAPDVEDDVKFVRRVIVDYPS